MVRNLKELGPNLQKIVTRLQTNQTLLKLLYYTDKDPLSNPDLTKEQIKSEIFEKLIKVIPRVGPKETAKSIYIFFSTKRCNSAPFFSFFCVLRKYICLPPK